MIYWQCPQCAETYDFDDWRVQPTDAEWANAKKWFRAFCPADKRELTRRTS